MKKQGAKINDLLTGKPIGFKFWLSWFLYTSISIIISLPSSFIIATLIIPLVPERLLWDQIYLESLILLLTGIFSGTIMGYMQNRILKKYIYINYLWLFSTTIGTTLALILTYVIENSLNNIILKWIMVALFGIILSITQWILFGRKYYYSKTWIISNSICWTISLYFGIIAGAPFISDTFDLFALLIIGFTIGVIAGISTGILQIKTFENIRKKMLPNPRLEPTWPSARGQGA